MGLTALENLSCYENQLTGLTLTGLAGLKNLACYKNQLTGLTVSGLDNLARLACYENQLTALDISGLTRLEELYCGNNEIATLGFAGCPALVHLSCSFNELGSLDVSGLAALTYLDCYVTKLNTLNVSGLNNLLYLNCSNNKLTSLNLADCTGLIRLYCYENKLSVLDVTPLTDLENLHCGYNQLSLLDVSALTGLKELHCNNNAMESLDVSGLTALEDFGCYNNKLPSLDLSTLSGLKTINCSNNLLPSLDFSGCLGLEYISCFSNPMEALDVSMLSDLESLYTSECRLTALNLTGCSALSSFDGTLQTPSLTMTWNGSEYEGAVTYSPTGLASGITYSGGQLIAANSSLPATPFTVAIANSSYTLSGAIQLTYSGGPLIYSVLLNAGTGATGSGAYAEGAIVNITAGTPPEGKIFSHWTANPSVTFADANSASTSFTMIAGTVTVIAQFVYASEPEPEPEPEPDLTDLYNAINLAQYLIIDVPQSEANTQSDAIKWLGDYFRIRLAEYAVSVSNIAFSVFEPAVEGSPANVNGTNGIITLSATFAKGLYDVPVYYIHGRIIATPYVGTANEYATRPPLKAISANGSLRITGLTPGDDLNIYNLSGTHIYNIRNIAAEAQVDIDPGVYIVASGNRRIKVVVK